MPTKTASRTNKATAKQLAILGLLYKFRFGTTDLFAHRLNLKDGRYIYTRLEALVEKGYVGKNYDNSYKLAGKPASYYLLSQSFPSLKRHCKETGRDLSTKTLQNIRKDVQVSDAFIAHKLAIFTIYDRLTELYGSDLGFWTKDELNLEKYSYFPQPMPDSYMCLKTVRSHSFLLNYLNNSTPYFVHVRRLRKLVEYIDMRQWERTGHDSPTVLLVCESMDLLKRVRKTLAQTVDEYDPPNFCYTTMQALQNSTQEDDEIWQNIAKPLELFTLKDT